MIRGLREYSAMTAIDTSTNTSKSLKTLRKHNVTAVGRYYRIIHPSWRLTKPEAKTLSKAKIAIWTVYEDSGDISLPLTKAQGKAHGENALKQATYIGQPRGTPIYFALEGLPDGYKRKHLPGIRKYFKGVKEAIGGSYQLGVYSDGIVCKTLLDEKICTYTWLSASLGFEGSRAFLKSGRWNIFQKTPLNQNWDGLSVDVDQIKADFGGFFVRVLRKTKRVHKKKPHYSRWDQARR
jgi:hypothetical protein